MLAVRTIVRRNRTGRTIGKIVRYHSNQTDKNKTLQSKVNLRDIFTLKRIRRYGPLGTFYNHIHCTYKPGRFSTKLLNLSQSMAGAGAYGGAIFGISYGIYKGLKISVLTLPLTCTLYGGLYSLGGVVTLGATPFLFPPIWFYLMFF